MAGRGGRLSAITVIPFRPEHAADFRRLNLDWIERLFKVEAPDLKVLDDPERAVIEPGGMIFFALEGGTVVGTVAMIAARAAAANWRRWGSPRRTSGAASARCSAGPGRPGPASTGFAGPSSKPTASLGNAIRLYERLGFRHAPWPHPSDYARGDVYMELDLDPARS